MLAHKTYWSCGPKWYGYRNETVTQLCNKTRKQTKKNRNGEKHEIRKLIHVV